MGNQQKSKTKHAIGDSVRVTSALAIATSTYKDGTPIFLTDDEIEFAGKKAVIIKRFRSGSEDVYGVQVGGLSGIIRGRHLLKETSQLPIPRKVLSHVLCGISDDDIIMIADIVSAELHHRKTGSYNYCGDLQPLIEKMQAFFRFNQFLLKPPIMSVLMMGTCRETDREFCNMLGWGELRKELIKIQ